jgi:hypothetical protein
LSWGVSKYHHITKNPHCIHATLLLNVSQNSVKRNTIAMYI